MVIKFAVERDREKRIQKKRELLVFPLEQLQIFSYCVWAILVFRACHGSFTSELLSVLNDPSDSDPHDPPEIAVNGAIEHSEVYYG